MTTITITDEAHWLSVRDMHVGGSDVAALFNRWILPDRSVQVYHAYESVPEGALPLGSCSPYKTAYRLFLERTGQLMPDEFKANERMDAGTFLEPAIAAWAMKKWDWKLRSVRRYHVHPRIEGWGASVDYEVVAKGMAPVEIKNVDGLIARDNWVIEGDDVIGCPLHIMLQLQHYIGAREAAGGWIVANIGGNHLTRGHFEMHVPTQARIAEAILAFWQGVKENRPPLETADYDSASDQFAFGDKGVVKDLTDDPDAKTLAKRLERWKAHEKFTTGVVDSLKAKMAIKLGDATKGLGDGFSVTWPAVTVKEKIVPEKVQPERNYRGGMTVRFMENSK